jgi:hypothetical protein
MTETYRRRPPRTAVGLVTLTRYQPPLKQITYEELRDVARLADDGAEISEVTFKPSGERVLLARHVYLGAAEYVIVEPGNCLAFCHEEEFLFEVSSADLKKMYEKQGQ